MNFQYSLQTGRQRKKPGFSVLISLALIASTGVGAAARAESTVKIEDLRSGFTLSYPAVFEDRSRTAAPAALLLTQPGGQFPTLNVIVVPEPYPANGAAASQGSRVLDDYRRVGLRSAHLRKTTSNPLPPGGVTAEIEYQQAAGRFVSLVAVIPGHQRHFIVTFIDNAAELEAHRGWFNSVVNSFRPLAPAGAAAGPAAANGGKHPDWYWWGGAAALLLLVALTVARAFLARP